MANVLVVLVGAAQDWQSSAYIPSLKLQPAEITYHVVDPMKKWSDDSPDPDPEGLRALLKGGNNRDNELYEMTLQQYLEDNQVQTGCNKVLILCFTVESTRESYPQVQGVPCAAINLGHSASYAEYSKGVEQVLFADYSSQSFQQKARECFDLRRAVIDAVYEIPEAASAPFDEQIESLQQLVFQYEDLQSSNEWRTDGLCAVYAGLLSGGILDVLKRIQQKLRLFVRQKQDNGLEGPELMAALRRSYPQTEPFQGLGIGHVLEMLDFLSHLEGRVLEAPPLHACTRQSNVC